jgi:hypothetical protein
VVPHRCGQAITRDRSDVPGDGYAVTFRLVPRVESLDRALLKALLLEVLAAEALAPALVFCNPAISASTTAISAATACASVALALDFEDSSVAICFSREASCFCRAAICVVLLLELLDPTAETIALS